MPIRLIASDMDGTLLAPDGSLSPRTGRALAQAAAAGARIVLSSGRMPASLVPFVVSASVNAPVIAYNGAQVIDLTRQETLFAQPIETTLCRAVAAFAEENDLYLQVYDESCYYFAARTEASDAYAAIAGLHGQAVGGPLSRWISRPSPKLLLIDQAARIPAIIAKMRMRFGGVLGITTSFPTYIECMDIRVDKGRALQETARALGIDIADTAAFGDGKNDLPLLRAAGIGCAMANACPETRSVADRIVPANAQDGVAVTIEEWLRAGAIEGG